MDILEFFENLFSPLIGVLGSSLEYFHSLGTPWWLSIAMLTVVVRTILFPLTVKQVKSMRAMQDLRPEMERIRAKYRDNRQKQQEEIMKLYQERKVNPLGGCLPIAVQMPVFIGMFYVIRHFGGIPGRMSPEYPSFHEGGLLWFQNLSVADPYHILPIVSALTMLAATEITAHNVEPQQRWLMRLLPVGVTVFLFNFPAGLFVYWITSNLVTFVQNYIIYHHGPGRRPPGGSLLSRFGGAGDGAKPQESGKQSNGGSGGQAPQSDAGGAAPAAKSAKRRRRKKK